MSWHLDRDLASGYARGTLSLGLAASVEQHLVQCPHCRSAVSVDPARLDRVWATIIERVEAPRRGFVERLLHRAGIDEPTARVVATTPIYRGAWLTSVVLTLALAVQLSQLDPRGVMLFIVLAPVLPLLGVAATFGARADPSQEITNATPYPALRLLIARTLFVVASTVLPALLASLFLPGSPAKAVAWLLPSLAITAVSLALAPRVAVDRAALMLVVGWLSLAAVQWSLSDGPTMADGRVLQVVSLAALVIASWSIVRRSHGLPHHARGLG